MRSILLSAILSVALVPAQATAQVAPSSAAPTFPTPSQRLQKLFVDDDEAALQRNPLNALFRGDLRYADRLGEFYTDAQAERNYRANRAELAQLLAIDRALLSPTEQISYDTYKALKELSIRGNTPEMRKLTDVRPIDHFFGAHTFYPDLASGQGIAPFKTVLDYRNNVKRHRQFAAQLDVAIGRFREGIASGVTQPKLVVRNMIEQLDRQLAAGVDGSPYVGPLKVFPDAVSAADRAALTLETRAAVSEAIFPAYVRLRDFLRDEYLPVARDGVGLVHMKGGRQLYAFLIESNTTLPMTATQVHTLGLSEVARIKREMDVVRRTVGFKGTLPEFLVHLRTDAKFKPPSKDWLRDRYVAIGKTVDLRIAEQFSTIPKSPLEIRAVPEFREKNEAGGSYNPGTPDGSRPGVFFFNGYDLPSRSTWGMETLYLHEGAPGHHFQISLAQENTALPPFMRFGGNTAYVEGWGLYAETLYRELGLQTDPYQRYGGLDDEMLRAMRLVVDTGIHDKSWTRDRAIEYMLANSAMGRTDATAEVERYIAIPGQALAYKIGQLTILRLKAKAKAALGAKFDPRDFHAQVLMTGALPMTVLEAKIDNWIARSKRGA